MTSKEKINLINNNFDKNQIQSLKRQLDQLNIELFKANKKINELEKVTNSSRWLFKNTLDKIIHAPRDISRRIRKSIKKRNVKSAAPTSENKTAANLVIDFEKKNVSNYIKQSRKEAKKAIKIANQENINQTWHIALKLWQEITFKYPSMEQYAGFAKTNISIIKRIINLDKYKNEILNYRETLKGEKHGEKIVIYTAILDNYDILKLPENLDDRFEYVVYTNTPLPDTGIFQIRPITFFQNDATRSARFIKTHPHILFEGYDIAVWIDANIMITGNIYPEVKSFIDSEKVIGAVPHPKRKDIYEEINACIQRDKDEPEIMQEQCEIYRNKNFQHSDLIESNFMMFKLQNEAVKDFFSTWWNEINNYSKRDQLSLNFSQKHNLDWYKLSEHPNSVRNHPSFAFVPHKDFDSFALETLFNKLQVKSSNPYIGNTYFENKRPRIEAQNSLSIDIIVPIHNAMMDVQKCLESLCATRQSEQQKLILIDDGSDIPTADYLKSFKQDKPWVKLHRNDNATGYTKAANKGMSLSEGEFIILLNSDTIVTSNWAEKLADAVFSSPNAGLVGPMSNAATYQSLPDINSKNDQTAVNDLPVGITIEDMNELCEKWTPEHIIPMVPLLHGFCFGITRELIKSIGLFDEVNFPRGYGEENDYCLRATEAGFNLVVATHTYVFHSKSKSYGKTKRKELSKAGNESLRRLHGVKRIKRAEAALRNNQILEAIRKQARSIVT